MTAFGPLFDYLWIAPHVLQVLVVVFMIRRKLVAEFPAFFLYTTYEIAQFVVLLGLYRYRGITDHQYMVIFLTGSIISSILRFAVVYGIFSYFFCHYPALSGLGRLIYRCTVALLLFVSVVVVAYTSGATNDYVSIWINILDRGVSIIQCGLLVVLFGMSRFLRFSWRNPAFGIALGMGLFASMELALSAVRALLGPTTAPLLLNTLTMGTYHVCVLIWAFYLWAPEREPQYKVESMPANLLDGWDAALQKVLGQ
jgi:hypothetical protein